MCGICGMIGPDASREVVEKMNAAIAHRGPDGNGFYQDKDVILGHRRLSIIDLVSGDQPITNEYRTIWVVLNGELYNYPDLRRDLIERGHVFSTSTDTEVLVHGYEEYGLNFLEKLDGIFSFALWDQPRRRLLLVRDYFGVKPLHYHFDGRTLRFGSEIKAILMDRRVPREVNYQALHYFLNLRYIPGVLTLFKDIYRLPAAHYLLFEQGNFHIERYREVLGEQRQGRHEESYYIDGIRHYLREAVRKQLISDVPVGVYLSGGLDSSSIVAYMSEVSDKPVQSFCLGFGEPTDELADARVIANHFGTTHHEMTIAPDPLRVFPEVIWHAEEPKENILQGYLLAQFARQQVKVVLGGLGGDELFAGYALHRYVQPSNRLHPLIPHAVARHVLRPLSESLFRQQNRSGLLRYDEYRRGLQLLLALGDPERYYLILRNTWDYDTGAFENLYGPVLREKTLQLTHTCFDQDFQTTDQHALEQVLLAEMRTKMVDDFLMNEDRTSMAHGLEVRVPFLDRDLVTFALSIPPEFKMPWNESKYLFKKAMAGVLPDHALRKKKWGFSFNPYYQFQKDLKRIASQVLTRERVEARGWFNYAYLRRILDHPPHPHLRWHYFMLWLILGLEIWGQMFLDGDPAHVELDLDAYRP